MLFRLVLSAVMVMFSGCVTTGQAPTRPLAIPYASTVVQADGQLDEACYREHAPLRDFVVAGDGKRYESSTKAWLFWNENALVCAFACEEATLAWAPPVANERDVDGQDRCELFLWTGNPQDAYYCIEAAPGNAVHDYRARFYRVFDDTWTPGAGTVCRASRTSSGYNVEIVLPKAAIESMGLKLEAGRRWRVGLFRADYDRYNGTPTWVTWIDRPRVPADFHVAESFGAAELMPR